MTVRKSWLACLILGLSLVISGCGGSEEKTESKSQAANDEGKTEQTPGDSGGGATANVDTSTPDGALMAVAEGFKTNKPEAIWEFLPASYQKDVNDVLHQYANTMDAELYGKGFTVVQKLVKILKEKKDFILGSQMVSQGLATSPLDAGELSKNWDVLVEFLDTVVNSDISDIEKMKTMDGGKYLAETGGKIMSQLSTASKMFPNDPFENDVKGQLSKVKVTLISVDGDTALVEFDDPRMGTSEREMKKVEGKWIPADMADGWSMMIEEMQNSISEMPSQLAANKEQAMGFITLIDGVLTAIDGAENQEQFDMAMQQAMLPIMGMVGSLMAPGGGSAAEPDIAFEPVEPDAARVIVLGTDDVDQLDKIFTAIGEASAAEEKNFTVGGRQAVMDFKPVTDFEAFTKLVKFGRIVETDNDSRTITILIDADAGAEPDFDDEKQP